MPPTKKKTMLALLGALAMLAGSSVQAQSGWSNSSGSDGGGWNDNNSNGGDGWEDNNGEGGGDAAQDNGEGGGQQQEGGGQAGADAGGSNGEIDCSFQGSPAAVADGISFRHILNQVDNTLTVELTYQGTGWVAFGVSADGQMPGSEVVIAMPDEAPSDSNPGKYSISGRIQDAIVLSGQQTLVDASFEQDGGTTVLRFTKALAETGELEISADGSNTFVYAVGSSNAFGYHAKRGSFSVAALTQCVLAGQTAAPTAEGGGGEIITGGDSGASAVPSKSLWVAHGILMFISWGILLPIGIGASLIRRLVPGSGTWFLVHRSANGLAFLLTTAGFGIAVYNVKANHFFSPNSPHKVIGLVIYVFMFLQVLGGIFRPHLPHAAPPKVVAHEDDVEADGADPDAKPAASAAPEQAEAPKKSNQRVAFEVGHRVFGYGLLGLSWYQLDLGVGLMAGFYGQEYDLSAAMWGVIGGISGLVFVLFVYTKAVPERKKD